MATNRVSKRPYDSAWSKSIDRGPRFRCMMRNTLTECLCGQAFDTVHELTSHAHNSDYHYMQTHAQLSPSVPHDPRRVSVSRVLGEQARSWNGCTEPAQLHVEEEVEPDQQEEEPVEPRPNDSFVARIATLEARAIADANELFRLRTERAAALAELYIVKSDHDSKTVEKTRWAVELLRGKEERRQLQNTITDLTAQRDEYCQNAEERRQAHEVAAASLGEVEKRCQSQEADLHALRKELNAAVNGHRQVNLERDEFRKQLHAANADSERTSERIRRLEEEVRATKEASDKRDEEHTKAVEELNASHNRALQDQERDLDKRREEVESQLAEMRTKLEESEKAKTEALERNETLQAALDEEIGSTRLLNADRLARHEFIKQWTNEERRTFEQQFDKWGKNFKEISNVLVTKTTSECVKYYRYFTKGIEKYIKMYRPKKTRRAKPGRRGKPASNEDQTETAAEEDEEVEEVEEEPFVNVPAWDPNSVPPMDEYRKESLETRI